jgi:Fe-S-cluster containining protein
MKKDDEKNTDGCRTCGGCCMELGSPPFLQRTDPDGVERWHFPNGMPQELIDEFVTYIRDVLNETIESRGGKNLPCYWLDEEKMLCKHYEFRPWVCRDFCCWLPWTMNPPPRDLS